MPCARIDVAEPTKGFGDYLKLSLDRSPLLLIRPKAVLIDACRPFEDATGSREHASQDT